MGMCFGSNHQRQAQEKKPEQKLDTKPNRVQEVDIVKSKLKVIRDKIQTAVSRKEKQKEELNREILTRYERNKNKKELLPLLSTKKDIDTFISNTDTRLQVINKTLRDIEMQQIDANMINVLDESNKYMAKVQQQLEDKDWRSIVEQSKEKYVGIEWEAEEEEDEQFKQLWHDLGGDKLDEKQKQPARRPNKTTNEATTIPQVKEVARNTEEETREIALA